MAFGLYTYCTDIQQKSETAAQVKDSIENAAPISNKISFVYDANDNLLLKLKGTNRGSYTSTVPDSFISLITEPSRLGEQDALEFMDYAKVYCTPIRFIDGAIESILDRNSYGVMITEYLPDLGIDERCVIASYLDTHMDTEDLLIYLVNQVPYGKDIAGVSEAAYTYFNCETADLTDIQWLFLGYLCGNDSVVDSATLNNFKSWYASTGNELTATEETELSAAVSSVSFTGLRGFIKNEVYEKLEISCGYTKDQIDELLDTQQLTIKTSISLPLQGAIQNNINSVLGKYGEVTSTDEYEVQGIVAVTDNASGLLKAIVPGRNSGGKASSIDLQDQLPAENVFRDFYTLFPLYSSEDYSPIKLINASTEDGKIIPVALKDISEEQLSCLDLYLPENIQQTMLKTLNGSVPSSTSVLNLSAAYSMLTRDGEYIKPSCIVEIRCGNEVLYTVESEKYAQVYNARASRVLLASLSEDGSTLSRNVTGGINSLWDVKVTPTYTIVAWVGKPSEATSSSMVSTDDVISLQEAAYKSTVAELKPDAKASFLVYDGLSSEEAKIKKANQDVFEKYITSERNQLANAVIDTVEAAQTFNATFNSVIDKLNKFQPYLDQNSWNTLKSEIDGYKRSRIDQLLVYSTALD